METQTILVIEDDASLRDMVQLILESDGYRVLAEANGRDALDVLRFRKPNLILLDMLMPVMNGWEFAAEYRRRFADCVPIVVMTAAKDVQQRASDVAASGFIGKPFNIDELLSLVRGVLNSSGRIAAEPGIK